jgi:hypothetical protein
MKSNLLFNVEKVVDVPALATDTSSSTSLTAVIKVSVFVRKSASKFAAVGSAGITCPG